MTRPLRINVAGGGWYHVTARGHNRRQIFSNSSDYRHFIDLLVQMTDRFRLRIHAYALMPNHYHVLISTPEGNLSSAFQWLNVSYSMWFNKKYNRSGSLFQGRFGAVLIQGSEWGLEASVYIHLNPVVMSSKGLGKQERAAERRGLSQPDKDEVKKRLDDLRSFEWSSYRAYAGYTEKPTWIESDSLLRRVNDSSEGYRNLIEERLKQGVEEDFMSKIKWGIVLGGNGLQGKSVAK